MISAHSVSGGYLFGGQHCQDMSVDVKIILKWTLSSHNDLATHHKSLQNLACLYIRSLFPPTLFSVCFEVEPEKITKGKLLKAICRTRKVCNCNRFKRALMFVRFAVAVSQWLCLRWVNWGQVYLIALPLWSTNTALTFSLFSNVIYTVHI